MHENKLGESIEIEVGAAESVERITNSNRYDEAGEKKWFNEQVQQLHSDKLEQTKKNNVGMPFDNEFEQEGLMWKLARARDG